MHTARARISLHHPDTRATAAEPIQFSSNVYRFYQDKRWFLKALRETAILANYVVEDFSFLHVNGLTKLAFPIACFRDIPFHADSGDTSRIIPHMNSYGGYGIGLPKS